MKAVYGIGREFVANKRKVPTSGASDEAKRLGAKSLQSVAEAAGLRWETLARWYRSRPALFRLVVLGSLEGGE